MEERNGLGEEERELVTEVDDLRKLIGTGGDPMIEDVIEEDKPRMVFRKRRSRFGRKRSY